MSNLLNLNNDYVFKRIFGHIGNENITKDLLDSILDEKITNVELDNNKILEKDLLDDKIGIIDINAKINNEISCDVEMQVVDKSNIEKRALYYWSKLYIKGIKNGEDYSKLKKTVIILILDYDFDKTKEINDYITRWNFREKKFPRLILTPVAEIYIIEMKKFKKGVNQMNYSKLDSWMKFIVNPEEIDVNTESNEAIKEAKRELEKISDDEHERYLADLREKYIMDTKAVEDAGYSKGLQCGIEQGIEQGFKNGVKEEKIKIAKKLKEKNTDINFIKELTGLSEKEIKEIK